jgi:hypothetical protein
VEMRGKAHALGVDAAARDVGLRESCGIDTSAALWSRRRSAYAGHLRWTRKLDRLVRAQHRVGMAPHPLLRSTFFDACQEAFVLSRAKGVADAAALMPAPPVATGLEPCMLDRGLPGGRHPGGNLTEATGRIVPARQPA